jgi:hypothetical protein
MKTEQEEKEAGRAFMKRMIKEGYEHRPQIALSAFLSCYLAAASRCRIPSSELMHVFEQSLIPYAEVEKKGFSK